MVALAAKVHVTEDGAAGLLPERQFPGPASNATSFFVELGTSGIHFPLPSPIFLKSETGAGV